VLHGSLSALLQTDEGQVVEAHSISAGLDYPGSGPEHAWLRDTGRATYVAVTDQEALETFRTVAQLEGIIPALETSHALCHALAPAESTLDLVSCSGRGDKDLAEVLQRLGIA
jgi:tryptophan synthase beta chain